MKWYCYLAIKQLFPTKRKLSFFSCTALCGITLGVVVLFVVMSIMNGFHFEVKRKIVEFQGDIQIIGNDPILTEVEEISEFLSTQEEIQSFMPYVNGIVMMYVGNRPIFPIVQGVDWEHSSALDKVLRQYLETDHFKGLDENSLLLSAAFAQKFGLTHQDTLKLYSPFFSENSQNATNFAPKEVHIAGILRDPQNFTTLPAVLCPISLLQGLYGLGKNIHGYSLYLNPKVEAIQYAEDLNALLKPSHIALSWLENHQELLSALKLEKAMMFFILLLVLLIAAFSVACTLTFNVVKKTREIGLLQALGATPKEIALCFSLQSIILGGLGTLAGFFISTGILFYRNSIFAAFISFLQHFQRFHNVYQYIQLPVHYSLQDILFIFFFSNGLCILAGFIPALKALKIPPAQALRSEG